MALLLATAAALVGIYDEGHFDRVHKCTTSNFEEYKTKTIDSGKTLFAPAWNTVTKAFENNTQVAFGDVNLSEEQIHGNYNPGAGGWPTIRYFNKETGPDGKFAGEWKDAKGLDGAMCDVFGNAEHMQAYVEEMGGTSLCSTVDGAGCSDKEKAFIEKWKAPDGSGIEGVAAQLKRLVGMKGNKMKPELKTWLGQRIAILKQLAPKDEL